MLLLFSLSCLCTHRRLAQLRRQTHLVCLAVGTERRALFPQGATCHMELMLITRKINKTRERNQKTVYSPGAINEQVFFFFFFFFPGDIGPETTFCSDTVHTVRWRGNHQDLVGWVNRQCKQYTRQYIQELTVYRGFGCQTIEERMTWTASVFS